MTAPRFELSGVMAPSGPPGPANPSSPPALVLTYNADATLDVKSYMDQGYTRFDVICIGAAGGPGGGVNQPYNSANFVYGYSNISYGGAGGGGGSQRIKGYLGALPDSVPIVVGAGGATGGVYTTDGPSGIAAGTPPPGITDGGDGGASSFNGTSCRASGGKGGKKVNSLEPPNAPFTNLTNNGGAGGTGGTTVAGGGGTGGIPAQVATPFNPAVPATPGSWDPNTMIGSGGGGGGGGGSYKNSATGSITRATATAGAGGSFNATDLAQYSPGGNALSGTVATGETSDISGYGGGAKAQALNGLGTTYGDSGPLALSPSTQVAGKKGVVIVRLTAS